MPRSRSSSRSWSGGPRRSRHAPPPPPAPHRARAATRPAETVPYHNISLYNFFVLERAGRLCRKDHKRDKEHDHDGKDAEHEPPVRAHALHVLEQLLLRFVHIDVGLFDVGVDPACEASAQRAKSANAGREREQGFVCTRSRPSGGRPSRAPASSRTAAPARPAQRPAGPAAERWTRAGGWSIRCSESPGAVS